MRNPCILSDRKCVDRSMKYAFAAILTTVLLLTGVDRSSAQTTLAVVGETITVTGGGVFYVSGPTEIIAGRIDGLDLSRLTFEGPVNVDDGGLYLFKDCLALITEDLRITTRGTCWRYRPGVLTVEGTIYNDGDLNNDGEIVIGRP